MISIGLKQIPHRMVLRRWTQRARSVMPAHLAEYGQANPALLAQTYRHSALFLAALELVKLGDRNVESFHIAMACISDAKEKLGGVSKEKDGLGLAEQQEQGRMQDGPCQNSGEAQDVAVDEFSLRAPKRKRAAGRPSNARDKPGYERASKRSRFCKGCNSSEHTRDRCPERDQSTIKPRKKPTCGGCGLYGHSITACGARRHVAAVVGVL